MTDSIPRDTTWGVVRDQINEFMAHPIAPGTISYDDLLDKPTLGSAAATSAAAYATAAEGELAVSAVQPGDLAPVATSGDYGDLDNKPTLGSAAAQDVTAFATAAEGDLAVSALQPAAIGSTVQAYDADLTAIAGLTSAANKVPYATGAGAWALMDRGTTGASILAMAAVSDVRNFLDTPLYVATRTAAKALDPTKDTTLILTEVGREGVFNVKAGSVPVTDPQEIVYFPSNTAGYYWERVFYNTIYANWAGTKADCTAQGVGTDVIPPLKAAIDLAVLIFGDGAQVVLPPGRYRGQTSAIVDLAGKRFVTIDAQGVITPDATSFSLLTFRNAQDLRLNANLLEGGIFNGWGAGSPFAIDYSANATVAGAGGQEAFRLEGILGCDLDLRAYGYAGRMLRTAKAQVGHPQTGGMRGTLFTTRNTDFSKARTAQCLWADYGTDTGVGYWGTLTRITNDFDAYGPVWVGLNDITTGLIDGAYGYTGIKILGCTVVRLGTTYVGDVDGPNASESHILIDATAGGVRSSDIVWDNMTFLNAKHGLRANKVNKLNGKVRHLGASSAYNTAIWMTDCTNVNIQGKVDGAGNTFVDMSGSETNNITLDLYSVTAPLSNQVIVASTVPTTALIRIKGRMALRSPYSGVISASDASIFMDIDFNGPAGASAITLVAPATAANKSRWLSGVVIGGAAKYGGFTPIYVSPAVV